MQTFSFYRNQLLVIHCYFPLANQSIQSHIIILKKTWYNWKIYLYSSLGRSIDLYFHLKKKHEERSFLLVYSPNKGGRWLQRPTQKVQLSIIGYNVTQELLLLLIPVVCHIYCFLCPLDMYEAAPESQHWDIWKALHFSPKKKHW